MRAVFKMGKKTFQYFLVFTAAILLSLFSWQKSAATRDNATQGTFLHNDISSISSYCEFAKLDLPFESTPTPVDCEVPNENEQEDDFDSDSNLLSEEQTPFNIFGLVAVENWFAQPSSFIQNRSSVPLFVLYHSWKTYLS